MATPSCRLCRPVLSTYTTEPSRLGHSYQKPGVTMVSDVNRQVIPPEGFDLLPEDLATHGTPASESLAVHVQRRGEEGAAHDSAPEGCLERSSGQGQGNGHGGEVRGIEGQGDGITRDGERVFLCIKVREGCRDHGKTGCSRSSYHPLVIDGRFNFVRVCVRVWSPSLHATVDTAALLRNPRINHQIMMGNHRAVQSSPYEVRHNNHAWISIAHAVVVLFLLSSHPTQCTA